MTLDKVLKIDCFQGPIQLEVSMIECTSGSTPGQAKHGFLLPSDCPLIALVLGLLSHEITSCL